MECLKKIVSDINAWKGPKIKLIHLHAHGEPLLNFNFTEMLSCITKEKCSERIRLVTNASLLNEKISQSLIDNEVDEVLISIYSINDKRLKYITSSNITADKIKNKIIKLKNMRDDAKKKKPKIKVKIIDTYSDENELFIKEYSDIADCIIIDKPMNWNDGEHGEYINKLYNDKTHIVEENIANKKGIKKVCVYPFHTMVIKSNGDVLACCVDWQKNTVIGNVMQESLKEIWNGKKLYNFRKMQIEGITINKLIR